MDFSSFFNYPDTTPRAQAEDLVFLADRGDEEWARLLAYTQIYRFQAGQVVIQAGEVDRALYLVASGTLEVLIAEGAKGSLRRVATIESGSVVGEQTFLDGKPRSAAVRGVTAGELLRLDLQDFERLAAQEPELARAVLFDLGRILSLRLRQTNALLASYAG